MNLKKWNDSFLTFHVFGKIFKCVIKMYNGPQKQFLNDKQYAEN